VTRPQITPRFLEPWYFGSVGPFYLGTTFGGPIQKWVRNSVPLLAPILGTKLVPDRLLSWYHPERVPEQEVYERSPEVAPG